jgi:hypothetical protein
MISELYHIKPDIEKSPGKHTLIGRPDEADLTGIRNI